MKHHLYYWWDRSVQSAPVGPFSTENLAKLGAFARAAPERDVLILRECAYSGPVTYKRDWKSQEETK